MAYGSTMAKIVAKRPAECSKTELKEFEDLVSTGGEVALRGLHQLVSAAAWLVFLFEEKKRAGVAGLKRPRAAYKRKVFSRADSPEDPDDFLLEVGWIVVEKSFRGRKYSRLLLGEVLRLAGDNHVYATTREANEPMRRTNEYCGMRPSDSAYSSEEHDQKLILYTKRDA